MENKSIFLKVRDHSVSGEFFELMYNSEFELLETHPQPTEEELPNYYQSEDYISHTDAKRNWFEKLYQLIKRIALNRKLKLINSFQSEEKKILDVGCGTGDFLKLAKDNLWHISGIEPNENARNIANQKTENCVFDVEDLLKFKVRNFDVITLWHVLEHLPKLENHLSVFESLLKPNGRLIIAVPNYNSYDAKHYKSYWAAYDVPRHLWHFSQTSIKKLVSKNNMEVVEVLPMSFDAYYVCLLSEKYKSGWMNPFKAFWNGLRSNLKAKHSKEYSSLIYVIKKA